MSDVRNQFARSILSKPVHATIRSIYPRLYQLHDGSDTMGTFDEQTGRLQMPPLLRSTYTWMQGQGVYFIGMLIVDYFLLTLRGYIQTMVRSLYYGLVQTRRSNYYKISLENLVPIKSHGYRCVNTVTKPKYHILSIIKVPSPLSRQLLF